MAKRKKHGKKTVARKRPRRKDGIKYVVKEIQSELKKLTGQEEEMQFHKKEQEVLFDFYFRVSKPIAQEGHFVSDKELHDMEQLLQQRLHEPIAEYKGRWFSIRELNVLFCYQQVMDIPGIAFKRRVELWKYLGDIANFHQKPQEFVDNIYLHLYKTILLCSDVRSKIYTLTLLHTPERNNRPRLDINSCVGVFHSVKKSIKIGGKYHTTYRVIKPRLNFPRFLNYNIGGFKQHHGTDLDEVPVYIQAHALNRMRERLDLLNDEALNYNLFENLVYFKHFYDVRSYILIPYHLYDVKVGYFFCQVIDDCFVIRTFLFITHFATPEGSDLRDICGLGKNDVPYWKIDRLSTFMNVDAEQYPKLSAMFEEAGCGDLFKLHNEEFSVEAMQTANLDGLREYLLKGKMEVEEPVEN